LDRYVIAINYPYKFMVSMPPIEMVKVMKKKGKMGLETMINDN
jgi:hypothetical protein